MDAGITGEKLKLSGIGPIRCSPMMSLDDVLGGVVATLSASADCWARPLMIGARPHRSCYRRKTWIRPHLRGGMFLNRCPQTEFFVADLGGWVCGVWEG